jgi:hypothetical protein
MLLKRYIEFAKRDPVKAVGYTCIVVGLLAVVGSIGFIATRGAVESQLGQDAYTATGPFGPPTFVMRHDKLIAVLQICVGVVLGLTGFFALRRRTWARDIAEILAWLALLNALVGWPLNFWEMAHARPSRTFIIFPAGVLVIIFWVVAFCLVIRYLRSEMVRNAFCRQ